MSPFRPNPGGAISDPLTLGTITIDGTQPAGGILESTGSSWVALSSTNEIGLLSDGGLGTHADLFVQGTQLPHAWFEFDTDEGGIKVFVSSIDPSAGTGVFAPVGSILFRTTGEIWQKTNVGNTQWSKYVHL